MHGVRRESEDNSRVRYLQPEEEQKLRETIRLSPAWREHEVELTLSLSTSLRRGSMYLHLRWENMDLSTRVATVPRTKNGDPVFVPLNADAMKALMVFRSRGDGTGRVVRNEAGEALNYPTHWFVPAVRAAGIQDYTWHDNRHYADPQTMPGECRMKPPLSVYKGLYLHPLELSPGIVSSDYRFLRNASNSSPAL